MSTVNFINEIILSSYLSTESKSVLANISLVMEFLWNVFTTYIFLKNFLHEALVTGRVTATSNNQMQLFK